MTYKQFDQATYDKYDPAKHQVVEWLKRRNFTAWINEDQYGIDVIADKDGIRYEIEVEVKNNWSGEYFQYSGVHFSNRKRKYVSNPSNTWFIMLNRERTHLLTVDGETFLNASVISKRTIYTEDEQFVEIPKEKCLFYKAMIE